MLNNLKRVIYDSLPDAQKFDILRAVFLLKNPRFIGTTEQQKRVKSQPLYIISVPRSGSSWVGEVLSYSEKSLYLKEPINQTYRMHYPNIPTVRTIDALEDFSLYRTLCQQSFSGSPKFIKSNLPFPDRWHTKEDDLTRVIKDVNPLSLQHIINVHAPNVLFLTRHPCAVLNSFVQKGWRGNQLQSAYTPEQFKTICEKYTLTLNDDFYYSFGQFQAVIELETKQLLQEYDNTLTVTYEELCLQPLDIFKKITQFSGLPFDQNLEQKIITSSSAKSDYQVGTYDVNRNSQAMVDQWRRHLTEEQIKKVQQGYEISSALSYFGMFD